ncbi:MAG TPA: hypothetical protein VNJ53_07855 [Gaiellaceae bacterium]|nr:hypothetical protein [Gaiellaceae bacterium]
MRGARGTILILLTLLLTACASTSAQLTTGELLDATGQAFLETAETWRAAHAQGLVTDAEYSAFAAWGVAFRSAWETAYRAWLAGQDPGQVRRVVEALRRELTIWALRLAERKQS